MLSQGASILVPENTQGKATDLEHSISLSTATEAINRFAIAKKRLFHPERWHKFAGKLTAVFNPVSIKGMEKNTAIELYEYIKIDIPGPGPSTGGHFDWVYISKIKDDFITGADESVGIQLKPCANPFGAKQNTAHFFNNAASSTFIIQREGIALRAFYHGRNEVPNNENVDFGDKIRNSIVAMAAMAGLSELQWKALITGFLA
jgi:hypothetical protein